MAKYILNDDNGFLTIKAADKINVQKVGEALEKIANVNNGKITPHAVVDAARDTKSPLHKHFEWDDAIAANAHRVEQARTLIRVIHVEADTEDGRARAFLSIRDKDGVSYRTVEEVLSSQDLQSKVLAQAERDLLAFEARYRNLCDICELIREARLKIEAKRKAETRAEA